jgi:alpha-tubulin suppressor-like RCC1 family protein
MRFAWSTSDASIATVDSVGVVTPVRPGTVEVSASAFKVGKATLEILPATEAVTVSPSRDTIFVDEPIVSAGDTARLTPQAFDPFGQQLTGVAFTWSSSSATVATVDASGNVHATGLGSATITVTANGRAATSIVTVMPLVASVSLTPTPPAQVLALDTLQLTAVARGYSNQVIPRTFTWTSSNTNVATVDANGLVIFKTTGQATFTARTAHRTSAASTTALERQLIALDAGEEFNCGFTPLGRGYCWGLSRDGRTAAQADSVCFEDTDPTNQDPCILPPMRMNRPELAFSTVSAGADFGCGITSDRLLYCWGSDSVGQIGNGLDGAGNTPELATVKSERFTSVSAGAQHACALNLVGMAFCWGNDSHGQLGDNRLIHSTTPIPVRDTTLQFRVISAGDRHTCGVTTAGTAYCWGDGTSGQLGNTSFASSQVPIQVSGGLSFLSISAGGSHTCALEASGNVYCWGDNARGQLGNGTLSTPSTAPTQVTGGGGFTAISSGFDHTCGIAGGAVKCWGGSDWGEVGDGSEGVHDVTSPITVAGLQATVISVGASHSCAITTAGVAMCWGSNRWGALGNEYQAAARATPQVVARPR